MDWAECEKGLRGVVTEALEGYEGMADVIIQETTLVEDVSWFIHTRVGDLEPDPKLTKGRYSLYTSLRLRLRYIWRNWREDR